MFPRFLLLAPIAAFLSGCAAFTAPESRPLLTDHVGQGQVVATTADRRIIYVDNSGLIACEPPPDAFQEISSKLDLNAALKGTGEVSEASLNLYREVSRRLQRLSVRSQGVIFFRDASFRLAEASLNEFLMKLKANKGHEPAPAAAASVSGAAVDGEDAAATKATSQVQIQSALDAWDRHFALLVTTAERLVIYELARNPQFTSLGTEGDLPDRLLDTGPDPVAQGGDVKIYYFNPASASRTVDIKVSSSLGGAQSTVTVDVGKDGLGTAKFTVPADWKHVLIEAPESRSRFLRVKS